jgi:carbonic anhydrase
MIVPTETESAGQADTSPATASGAETENRQGGRLGSFLPQRREAMFLIGGGLLGAALGGGGAAYALHSPGAPVRDDEVELSSDEGRERLESGNARYVAGKPEHADQSIERRDGVAEAEAPFAAILSCADSRVPPEVIFDQGLGDLFVVRSAGQVIDHAVLGSLQYGVEHLKTSLLVVLGHSDCSAVRATVEAMQKKSKPTGTDVDALIAAIRPAVVEAEETGADKTNVVSVSIDINVERMVAHLKTVQVLKEASTLRKVKIVGAVYNVETSQVSWL